jgi:hypothetical protein
VKSETEFHSILSKIIEERADALFVFPEFVNNKYEKAILDFASGQCSRDAAVVFDNRGALVLRLAPGDGCVALWVARRQGARSVVRRR